MPIIPASRESTNRNRSRCRLWVQVPVSLKNSNNQKVGQLWLTPVILATQEAEIRIVVWCQPQANSSWDPISKKHITKCGSSSKSNRLARPWVQTLVQPKIPQQQQKISNIKMTRGMALMVVSQAWGPEFNPCYWKKNKRSWGLNLGPPTC
jgi:hypothetical protein